MTSQGGGCTILSLRIAESGARRFNSVLLILYIYGSSIAWQGGLPSIVSTEPL